MMVTCCAWHACRSIAFFEDLPPRMSLGGSAQARTANKSVKKLVPKKVQKREIDKESNGSGKEGNKKIKAHPYTPPPPDRPPLAESILLIP